MTPSDYGQGHSLEHDRMQADVLDFLQSYAATTMNADYHGEQIELTRAGPWPEVALTIDGTIRGFADILERWSPTKTHDSKNRMINRTRFVAYEIKPKLTTVGGLIRQMQAEELLIERWGSRNGSSDIKVRMIPIVMHNDPEVPLLRRLWHGPVGLWNAEEKTLS